MPSRVAETVRKLIRASRGNPTPEGRLALERARELAARHGLEVSTETDEYRLAVAGVAGRYWCEQLLVAMAREHCCVVVAVVGQKPRAVLRGERSDVLATARAYRYAWLQIICGWWRAWSKLRSPQSWLNINNISITELREAFEEIANAPKGPRTREQARVYLRSFMISAASRLVDRLCPRTASAPLPPSVNPVVAGARRDLKQEAEVAEVAAHVKRLADLIGNGSEAVRLHERAVADGARCADEVDPNWRRARLLTAASSFLPPPPPPPSPSRFNQLDID